MENGKRNIDDLFRDSLEGMEAEFSMEAWEKLEAQLPKDSGSSGRRKFWLGILLLVAGLASSGIILSIYSGNKKEAKQQAQSELTSSRATADPRSSFPDRTEKTSSESLRNNINTPVPGAISAKAEPENQASQAISAVIPELKGKQPTLNKQPDPLLSDAGMSGLNNAGIVKPAPHFQSPRIKPGRVSNEGKDDGGISSRVKTMDQHGSLARDDESISIRNRDQETGDAFAIPPPQNQPLNGIRIKRQSPELMAATGPVIDPIATQMPPSPAAIRKPRDTRTSLAFGAGVNYSIGGYAPGYGWGLVWTNPLGRFPAWQLGLKYNRLRGYDFYSKNVSTSFGTTLNVLTKEARIDNLYLLQMPLVYRLNQAQGEKAGRINWGLGLEASWLLQARADYKETITGNSTGFSSVTGVPIMNGLNRFNLGLITTGEIDLSQKLRLQLAAGIGLTDLTNNKYYRNKKFQGLNYIQANLQYQLFKKK